MASVRSGIRTTLVYFGLAEPVDVPATKPGRRDEWLGLLLLLVVVPWELGAHRRWVVGVAVAALFFPTAVVGWVARGTTAHRRADLLAASTAVFALVTLVLSRHATLWIPFTFAAFFFALALVRELWRDDATGQVEAEASGSATHQSL